MSTPRLPRRNTKPALNAGEIPWVANRSLLVLILLKAADRNLAFCAPAAAAVSISPANGTAAALQPVQPPAFTEFVFWKQRLEAEETSMVQRDALLSGAACALSARAARAARLAQTYKTIDRAEVIELLHSRLHGARSVP
jgi:adenylosuccinate lyase